VYKMNTIKNLKEFSWKFIGEYVKTIKSYQQWDLINGPANSQATLRLFGKAETSVRVTLYRDHHAWCPYCQKVWLFLEEKRIPYRIRKVTMFCYGDKENWYKQICPSGMLPAIDIDGKVITQSDDILMELERQFGTLKNKSMSSEDVFAIRQLERKLFSAWCRWLCYPGGDANGQGMFEKVVTTVENQLISTGPYMLGKEFTIAEIVFIPYIERMNASLYFYKGYTLRDNVKFPHLAEWFDAIESQETYRGTQSDFHTHCHDLPPQMGGCYRSGSDLQKKCEKSIDSCVDFSLPETKVKEPENSRDFALARVFKFKDYIIKANPVNDKEAVDKSLRLALFYMMTNKQLQEEHPPKSSDISLRYIRDRVNVPRDMPIWSARRLREALEFVANLTGNKNATPISEADRKDQNPKAFGKV